MTFAVALATPAFKQLTEDHAQACATHLVDARKVVMRGESGGAANW